MDKKRLPLLILLIIGIIIVGAIIDQWIIDNDGSVASINCEVYWDKALTTPVTSIDWGVIDPGEEVTRVVYVYLNGNQDSLLTFYAQNFNPPTAQSYIAMTWNVTSGYHTAGSIVPAELKLDLDGGVTGFIDFSFDTVIQASD
jgi:hypothetical protein